MSPTVFLTAGHCTDGAVAARVWLDESVQDNEEYPFGGVTSYGINGNCAGTGGVYRVDRADDLNWLTSKFGRLLG